MKKFLEDMLKFKHIQEICKSLGIKIEQVCKGNINLLISISESKIIGSHLEGVEYEQNYS